MICLASQYRPSQAAISTVRKSSASCLGNETYLPKTGSIARDIDIPPVSVVRSELSTGPASTIEGKQLRSSTSQYTSMAVERLGEHDVTA